MHSRVPAVAEVDATVPVVRPDSTFELAIRCLGRQVVVDPCVGLVFLTGTAPLDLKTVVRVLLLAPHAGLVIVPMMLLL